MRRVGEREIRTGTHASPRFGRNFDPKSFPQEGGSGEPDPYLQRKPTRTLHRAAVREKNDNVPKRSPDFGFLDFWILVFGICLLGIFGILHE